MTTRDSASRRRFPEHSPTVAGRWLASDMRRLRIQAGLKQTDVAHELRCTNSKIGHLESGHTPIRRTDLLVMLPMYGVPEERRGWYLDLCDKARQKGWWDGTDGVPPWFSLHIGLEWGAESIEEFELGFVPGLLQTREYVTAMLAANDADASHSSRIVEQRMQRQQVLHRSPDPLRIHMVLDEAVLHRVVGTSAVMRDQWKQLVLLAEAPNVKLQVLPYEAGVHRSHLGSFKLLDFPSPDDPGVAYIETLRGGLYLEENDELEEFREAFDSLCALALTPNETTGFLEKLARSRT